MSHLSLNNDNEEQKLKDLLGIETGFVTPDAYFEELPFSIKLQIGEISESDFTVIYKHEYPFAPPPDYFDRLKSRIQSSIQQEENIEPIPLIPTNETGFDLPEGYFEQNKFSILNETAQQKNTIEVEKQNTFNVDENYFEKSKQHILANTTHQNKNTTYRRLFQKPSIKNLVRYAAVITIAFGLGYFSNRKQNIVVYNNNGQLSKPVIIEDITYEELQAALFDEDLDNEDLIEISNMQTPTANNNTNQKTNGKVKNTKYKMDYAPTQQQIEQYILDNNDDINTDEL